MGADSIKQLIKNTNNNRSFWGLGSPGGPGEPSERWRGSPTALVKGRPGSTRPTRLKMQIIVCPLGLGPAYHAILPIVFSVVFLCVSVVFCFHCVCVQCFYFLFFILVSVVFCDFVFFLVLTMFPVLFFVFVCLFLFFCFLLCQPMCLSS